jgi:hypothetical protein
MPVTPRMAMLTVAFALRLAAGLAFAARAAAARSTE